MPAPSAIERPRPSPPGQRPPTTRGWTRAAVNFLLDAVLLCGLLLLVWVTAVLRLLFPQPTAADGWTLWGYSYNQWAGVQFALLAGFAALILLHVMLHWSWVCGLVASRLSRLRGRSVRLDDGGRTLYGVATLIVILHLLAAAFAAAALSIRAP